MFKICFYVPVEHAEKVKESMFEAGAGNIGEYSEVSFSVEGIGSFKGSANTHPFVGEPGKLHLEKELKIEVIFPSPIQSTLVKALMQAHPYEEVAFEIITLDNDYQQVGSGLIGELPEPLNEIGFLHLLKTAFGLSVVRHSPLLGKPVQKVAICGGAGSFLIGNALSAGADIYVSSDMKYHEFFDANSRLVLADIGHWESEQFTTELIIEILQAKFPTFAVLKSGIKTNPVNYFLG